MNRMKTTFSINAGAHDGTLDTLQIRTGHATANGALSTLRRYMAGQGYESLVAMPCEDGVYVYLAQNDADRDPDGSHAFAVIDAIEEESFETAELERDLVHCWAYFPEADESEDKMPLKSFDGYEMGNYFDGEIEEGYPSREAAIAALKAAYRGPDRYGVGLRLNDL
jgi:hypothetical protein